MLVRELIDELMLRDPDGEVMVPGEFGYGGPGAPVTQIFDGMEVQWVGEVATRVATVLIGPAEAS